MTVTVPKYTFKPAWKEIDDPSENKELINTQAQRLFAPMSGVFVDNPYSDEPEVLLGGLEDAAITVKVYQPGPDKYTRAFLPDSATQTPNEHGQLMRSFHQGVGKDGDHLVIAGGTPYRDGGSQAACAPSKKVFTVDALTRKVESLPDMKVGRSAPQVGSSPDGRYLLVAGGVTRDSYKEWGKISDVIEVYDTKTKEWVDVEAIFPGLSKMPASRFGGSAAWVCDGDVHRLFLVGGSSGNAQGMFGGFDASPPTQRIDVYDFKTCKWTEAELPTPRMYPGVDIRKLPDGKPEIVVAGGGTGVAASTPVDPQIYAVERINPCTLGISFGQHVPEQPAIKIGDHRARDWSANALVFATGFESQKQAFQKGAEMGFFFGFSKAFKGALLENETPAQAKQAS